MPTKSSKKARTWKRWGVISQGELLYNMYAIEDFAERFGCDFKKRYGVECVPVQIKITEIKPRRGKMS